MMRAIKFRGKRRYGGEWIHGSLLTDNQTVFEILYPDTQLDGTLKFLHFEVDPDTIGQYTGLKDKNGKDVYDGDILKTTRRIGYVAWSDKYCAFVYVPVVTHPDHLSKEPILLYAINTENWETAGNIHENPELELLK